MGEQKTGVNEDEQRKALSVNMGHLGDIIQFSLDNSPVVTVEGRLVKLMSTYFFIIISPLW